MNREINRWDIVGILIVVAGLLLGAMTGLRWYVFVPLIVAGFLPVFYGSLRYERRLATSVREHLSSRLQLDPKGFADCYFPENQREVALFIRQELDSYVPFSLAGLHPDDRFIDDLQLDFWDDFACVDLVRRIEKHFAIKIPNSDAERILTVRELADYVQMKTEGAARN